MDAIVYVDYRENKTDRRGEETFVKVEQLLTAGVPKDSFLALRVTVQEPVWEPQSLPARMAAAWFARIGSSRLQKRHQAISRQIRQELDPLLDEWGENACIYDGTCPWILPAVGLPAFDGYRDFRWIRRLLPYATNEHFLVLGTVPCIGQIFETIAPRTKSLMWVVPDYTYRAQAESIARMLSEEYGLVVDLRFLPEGTVFSRVRIHGKYLTEPMNILDLTGEKYVPFLTPEQGSVWIDAGALEEKARRIRGRGLAVQYISLRTVSGQNFRKSFPETQHGS